MSHNAMPDDVAPAKVRRWVRLPMLVLGLICAVGLFLATARLTLEMQNRYAPDGAFFCSPLNVAAIVLFIAIASLSIPVGFLLANAVLWIGSGTRAGKSERRSQQTFHAANAGLVRFAGLLAVVLLPVYVVAVGSEVCLSDKQVFYRKSSFSLLKTYRLDEIVELHPQCTRGSRGGWEVGLEAKMTDGLSFNFAAVGPWFSTWHEEILNVLRERSANLSEIDPQCPESLRALITRK
jgi:hypothetical protein